MDILMILATFMLMKNYSTDLCRLLLSQMTHPEIKQLKHN